MARQVAALPKKTFELYRSKKILSSSDHAFFPPSSNQILKDKLAPNSFTITTPVDNLPKELSAVQNKEDVIWSADNPVDLVDTEVKQKSKNKKKRKSKKGKVPISLQESSVANSISSAEEPRAGNLEMKHKVLGLENCAPLHVTMNTNLVADISNGRDLETTQSSKTIEMDLTSCGSSSSNDSGIVTPDSGLGSHTSPVFAKEPPFGFPPSSEKLLESALELLPNVKLGSANSSSKTDTTKYIKNSSPDCGSNQKEAEQEVKNCQATATDTRDLLQKDNVKEDINSYDIEDDPVSDISDVKEVCKDFVVLEGDSVDGDVSSSSAVEEEGGWQSQTKRSHRKKKKDLAVRTNREKNHMERFQRRDFPKQQSDSQFRKNHHHRKCVDDKKSHFKSSENRNSTFYVEPSIMNSIVNGQLQVKTAKDNEAKFNKGPDNKGFSYRDALIKARGKGEPNESSDSGVDANSVSSCEMSSRQVETPRDTFNKQQCVDYLRNAWKKVMLEAKEGLVIRFSVDSDPVLCQQKRKQQAANKMNAKMH